MEQMSQELDINQYDIKGIQKLYNQICNNNIFLNTYTLSDVEESKKKVFFDLMKKYNYKNESYIQTFVDDSATQLINHLFKNIDGSDKNTQMVGVKNVIQDIRKVNQDIPIIFLTAKSQKDNVISALNITSHLGGILDATASGAL